MPFDDDDFVDEDERLIDDTAATTPPPAGAHDDDGSADGGGGEEEAPRPEFDSVYDFVEQHLVFLYERKIVQSQDRAWCRQWWMHPEAVSRLEALWRAWESLRTDPATGMSVWWRDHADPHMSALLDPAGPFWACSAERGHETRGVIEPIPVEPMNEAAVRAAMSVA